MESDQFRSEFFDGTSMSDGEIKNRELIRCQQALKYIKAKVHPYIKDFLADDLEKTTAEMEEYAQSSNGRWKTGYVDVVMPEISWQAYHQWFMTAIKNRDEITLQVAHPDHYLNAATGTETIKVDIIENFGEDDLP